MDSGQLIIAWGAGQEIIHVRGSGVWTQESVDAHFRELRDHVADMRVRCGTALVLVDLTHAPVQSADIAARVKAKTDDLHLPGDRFAAIVQSSLAKLELRRSVNLEYMEIFVSRNAALTWINAYNFRPGGRSVASLQADRSIGMLH